MERAYTHLEVFFSYSTPHICRPRRAAPHAIKDEQLQRSSSPYPALASSPSGTSERAAEEMALEAMASILVPTTTSTSLAKRSGLKRKAEALDLDNSTAATPSSSKTRAAEQQASALHVHAAAPSPPSNRTVAPPGRSSGMAAAASAPSLLSRLSPMVPRQAVPHPEPCAAASEASAKRQRRGGIPAKERRLERRRLERLAREGEDAKAEQAKDPNRS